MTALLHSESRFLQETLIQREKFLILHCRCLGIFLVPDREAGQFFQSLGKRQKNQSGKNIKHTVNYGDACGARCLGHERKIHKKVQEIEQAHKDGRTDDVEVKVYHSRPFCIFAGSHCGEKGGHTGTDVLAHDDRQGHIIAHCSGHAEGLQNTNGSGRTLDDCCQKGSCQHTEERVGETGQKAGKFRHICQRFHRSAHGLHSGHQDGKTKKDGSDIFLFLIFAEHDKNHTDQSQNRPKCGGFTELHHKVAALNTGKA